MKHFLPILAVLLSTCDAANFGASDGQNGVSSKDCAKSKQGCNNGSQRPPSGPSVPMGPPELTYVCGDKKYRVGNECVDAVPVYRWYEPKSGDHFYTTAAGPNCLGKTTFAVECGGNGSTVGGEVVNEAKYNYEGPAFWALPPNYREVEGLVNFYRLYHPTTGKHFYTLKIDEKTIAISGGHNLEGAYQVFPIEQKFTKPIYQWYSKGSLDNFYSFAAGPECAGKVSSDPLCGGETVNEGNYTFVGIAGYLFPN